MHSKPFRPPLLKRPQSRVSNEVNELQPAAKRRRPSPDAVDQDDDSSSEKSFEESPPASSIRQKTVARKPLLTVKNIPPSSQNVESKDVSPEAHYNVLWRKFTAKKHKTWDGDGLLAVREGYARLRDESGRDMGRSACGVELMPGVIISIGGKEVEVQSRVERSEFLAGKNFLGGTNKTTFSDLDAKLRTNVSFTLPRSSVGRDLSKDEVKPRQLANQGRAERIRTIVPTTAASKSGFKNPLLDKTVVSKGNSSKPIPRHDPDAPGALVMKQPSTVPKGKQLVDVVVDPLICKHLREHQREGVQFLYECVMGMRPFDGQGAILADEMGLGKTLQVICLLWTLLKQNPVADAPPVIKKALIVCPATLIRNWRKEFRKWLGNERIGVLVVEGNKTRITDFTMGRSYSILVIGYEKLRTVQAELQKGSGVDIVIADEGHRLKTAQNKSAQAIKSLSTSRKIILSGTPLQNDLSEFFFMADFVNPGLLGKVNSFKKEFETPILKSRQPDANEKDVEKGESRSETLAELTGQFILRRTADILSKYLPPKTENIIFCRPTSAQVSVYRKILESPVFNAVLRSSDASFQLITILKKLCNSPVLLKSKEDTKNDEDSLIGSLISSISPNLLKSPGASGKLQVLDSLLHIIRTTTQEKVVLVSHYTSTLDILGNLLTSLSYPWLRLDGSTPAAKRQDLVDRFNRTDASTCFAFLLSAKSGGAGINLVGASRLILFDVDWNPSTDLQAMARIHRDGQKRPSRIYRLLTQGALDEKIYQRQLTKLSLADAVVDNKTSTSNFTHDELRKLFELDEGSKCRTHELLGCTCNGRGIPARPDDGDDDDDDDDETPEVDEYIDIDAISSEPENLDSDSVLARLGMMKASQINAAAAAAATAKLAARARGKGKGKDKIQALMQWRHIDPKEFSIAPEAVDDDMEALVDDEVLMDVLKDRECRVGYVFSKTVS